MEVKEKGEEEDKGCRRKKGTILSNRKRETVVLSKRKLFVSKARAIGRGGWEW